MRYGTLANRSRGENIYSFSVAFTRHDAFAFTALHKTTTRHLDYFSCLEGKFKSKYLKYKKTECPQDYGMFCFFPLHIFEGRIVDDKRDTFTSARLLHLCH